MIIRRKNTKKFWSDQQWNQLSIRFSQMGKIQSPTASFKIGIPHAYSHPFPCPPLTCTDAHAEKEGEQNASCGFDFLHPCTSQDWCTKPEIISTTLTTAILHGNKLISTQTIDKWTEVYCISFQSGWFHTSSVFQKLCYEACFISLQYVSN